MSGSASSSKAKVAAVSIVASASMAAIKFVVGIAIGSLALISEALHSSVDLAATIVTWIVGRISDRPADERDTGARCGGTHAASPLGLTRRASTRRSES